jgi:hypothetical protein
MKLQSAEEELDKNWLGLNSLLEFADAFHNVPGFIFSLSCF